MAKNDSKILGRNTEENKMGVRVSERASRFSVCSGTKGKMEVSFIVAVIRCRMSEWMSSSAALAMSWGILSLLYF